MPTETLWTIERVEELWARTPKTFHASEGLPELLTAAKPIIRYLLDALAEADGIIKSHNNGEWETNQQLRARNSDLLDSLTTARRDHFNEALRIARGTKTDPEWGNMFLTRDEIVAKLEAVRDKEK